jgi:hypothetical protein
MTTITHTAINPDTLETGPVVGWPKGVTHAAILAAIERLPEHLDGPAAIAEALCNALGVEVPDKRAPWEVAYEAIYSVPGSPGDARNTWKVAWAACEAHHGITTGQGQQL